MARHRFLVGGREHTVTVETRDGEYVVSLDGGEPVTLEAKVSGVPGMVMTFAEGRPSQAFVARRSQGYDITVGGRLFEVRSVVGSGKGRSVVGGAEDPLGKVSAPLAGVVVAVHVTVGEHVEAGQVLAVVEAMKMQNEVHAPHAGTITAVRYEAGARVERGDILVEYEPDEAPRSEG